MAVLNDTKIFLPHNALGNLIYVDMDMQNSGETLWKVNQTKNDEQLRQIAEHYPALLEKLVREAAEFKPYISVVMPIKNPANVDTYLKNIYRQSFPEFELILVNLGSYLESQTLPTNFHVVNYPGGSLENALKLGLQKATGEYVLFIKENTTFFKDSLEKVAQLADSSKADVLHFSGHEEKGYFISDDSFKLGRKSPTLSDSPRQSRASLWLEKKLSRRLDTKIFNREFLTKHDINFDGGTSEFMFHALIQAKKYLIVPQAFCKE